MTKLNLYCLSLYNEDYKKIKKIGYHPVGLGKNKFGRGWIRDNTGKNISSKNEYYGEYTFHYWFWKNKLKTINKKEWYGFCAYRRFWTSSEKILEINKKKDFLKKVPKEWKNYDVILGNPISMDGWTLMKILKHGLKSFILNPKFFLKKNWNLKLHFDSFHGYGNLDKAINLLNKKDREDFKSFMNNQNFFNRGNMFICNSKKIMNKYYNEIFRWLDKCEKVFGFRKNSYGETRIYGFLMERYSSYWFNKYTKVRNWPIAFFDIHKNNKF